MAAARWLSSMTLLVAALVLAGACAPAPSPEPEPPGTWALAIHGGAGAIPRDSPQDLQQAYRRSLSNALETGRRMLAEGAASLDVVETVIRRLEDDPLFNAGRGAVYTHDGRHELDAALMRGEDLACGAVAALRTVRHPITLARRVMERTRHILLVGEGAEAFADETGVERVDPAFFDTERRRRQWLEFLERSRHHGPANEERSTVGVVALDRRGHLAAGTSTGGLTGKRFGRVGDVPLIGAGTYADDRSCAVSCTGVGEAFIRHSVAHSISALMSLAGMDVQQAARRMIHDVLEPGVGGVIAVGRDGTLALEFNTPGMYRGAANSKGLFQVGIWEDGP
ncbi:MAG: isoaspartyl peptidase/L-asparaginase [Acidobacteriota bacterium]|nr:isoaspartyl peptidase/L-asparaginase [Acidobacteriota bacterium]